MEKIALDIVGISSSQTQMGAYALILAERSGSRRLPIIIGAYEAQAIAIELEKMKPQRPLTHDLFRSFALSHQIIVKEIVINKFQEGVFFAEIYSIDPNGNEVVTDSRTSDAIAIALRFDCSVYTYESVLSQTGIVIEPEPEEEEDEEEVSFHETPVEQLHDLQDYDLEKLKSMLEEAVNKEHYELASKIRDEINRRKSQHD